MKHTEKSLIDWNEKIDLSKKETSRTYRFPNNEFVTITKPQFLIVSDNGHRLLDGDGTSHYVPYGWIELTWENVDERSFVCLDNFNKDQPTEVDEIPQPETIRENVNI